MMIDEVKRNLKYTYEKHRNDNIATFGTNISHMAMDCYNAIEQLEKEKTEAYNKSLDDFVKFANTMPTVEEEDGEIRPMRLEEIAEQLKAGGK